jgi:hypothetical protein
MEGIMPNDKPKKPVSPEEPNVFGDSVIKPEPNIETFLPYSRIHPPKKDYKKRLIKPHMVDDKIRIIPI